MTDYGCTFGQPHDLYVIHESASAKWEECRRCTRKFRWTRGFKGRVNNREYLKAHARNYAQPGGATNRLFQKLHYPEKCIIKIP